MIKAAVIAALLCLGAGCSQEESDAQSNVGKAEPTPVVQRGLAEVCPEVEAVLPRKMMVPSEKQLAKIRAEVEELRAEADLEAANALEIFIDGIDGAQRAYDDPSALMPALDVSEAFDTGLSAFATRCKAAGSSALQ